MTRMQVSTDVDHLATSLLPAEPTRDQLEAFGHFVQSMEAQYGVVDIGTMHHHVGGLYGRSVVIPAKSYLVGLPHKAAHLNVCVGDITVWTEGASRRLTGAHIVPSVSGSVRVGFAHAETTWLSVHRNDTGVTDERIIEDALVEHAERLMTRRHATPELESA
jgi:hypothetical protein